MDTWLASIDPTLIERWLAYDRLEPISSPWQHTATLAFAMWEAIRRLATAQGVDLPARLPDAWIPSRESRETPRESATSPSERMDAAEIQSLLHRKFGTGR